MPPVTPHIDQDPDRPQQAGSSSRRRFDPDRRRSPWAACPGVDRAGRGQRVAPRRCSGPTSSPSRADGPSGPTAGPRRRRARRRARATTCFALLERHEATGKAGEVVDRASSTPRADDRDLRLVLLVGVGDAGTRRPPARRRGAGPRQPRTGEPWPPRRRRSPTTTGLRGVRRGAGAGLLRVPLALRRAATAQPVRRVVLAGWSTPTTGRAVLDKAVAVAAGAGWRARTSPWCPPT